MSLDCPCLIAFCFLCHSTISVRSRAEFAGGFVVDFVLTQNALSLVFAASSSAVTTYLVLLASLAGSIIGVFSVLVKRLESMFAIRDEAAEDATKHVPQIDEGAETRFGPRVGYRGNHGTASCENITITLNFVPPDAARTLIVLLSITHVFSRHQEQVSHTVSALFSHLLPASSELAFRGSPSAPPQGALKELSQTIRDHASELLDLKRAHALRHMVR